VVIGEAVETAAQHQWLLANGVDAVQGFAISSPLAEQDFSEWLRRYRFAAVR
jgi:EAL domain-containing protein (putative c-di-GMP-specific phosphodiesterase class I)